MNEADTQNNPESQYSRMSLSPGAPIKPHSTSNFPARSKEVIIPITKVKTIVKRLQRKRSKNSNLKTFLSKQLPNAIKRTNKVKETQKNKVKKILFGQEQTRGEEKMSVPKKQKIEVKESSKEVEEEGHAL